MYLAVTKPFKQLLTVGVFLPSRVSCNRPFIVSSTIVEQIEQVWIHFTLLQVKYALISAQRCMICQGDIARYREQASDSANYGKARR